MTTPQSRYELIETLGTGATSRVDKARDTLIGRTVALKTFLHGFGSSDVQKQFLREAQIIGGLAHPFIVGLYDVGTNSDGVPYFVMEYVEGKTLEKVLDAGALPLEKAVVWTTDLAAALSRAHRAKVIHGDLKPANVLVTKEGQVKLGDFGIARFATQVSASGNLMGTPAYLSPEQIQGQTQDTRSDLFSLGIILYQMTTGVRPFNGSSVSAVCAQIVAVTPPPPSHHNPNLPAAFDRVVMRCLAKDPADRYATAEALGASLYPFAHAKENAPAVAESVSAKRQMVQRSQAWAVATLKSLAGTLEELSRRAPGALKTMWNSKAMWWNRPMQRRDLYAAGGVALALIALVPIARALRNREHQEPVAAAPVVSANSSPSPSPEVARAASQAPIISNASIINVSGTVEPERTLMTVDGDATEADNATVEPKEEAVKPVVAAHAFERHTVATPKPTRNAENKASALKNSLPLVSPGMLATPTLVKAPVPAAVAHTTLRIDIQSGVGDQTLEVYSGDELLLTTPLQAAHVGDTLRFNCPITAGEHALRVVLYRGDKTVFLHKENNSELHAESTNTMAVKVHRKSKMLWKHETSLEVVWPSSTTSSSVLAKPGIKTAGALALR
ncbi:MAG: serine/threonine protein kinase [Acidobacteriota bacterium]|nr:serine/threonine protein kinase [Acidobacteriota bacterium]